MAMKFERPHKISEYVVTTTFDKRVSSLIYQQQHGQKIFIGLFIILKYKVISLEMLFMIIFTI